MNHKVRKIRKKLKSELDTDRYEHTLGVMYTASSLAMCHGEDIEKALLPDSCMIAPNAFLQKPRSVSVTNIT